MKHNKHENDIEQESVLGFLKRLAFYKKGKSRIKELEQELGTLASKSFTLLILTLARLDITL
jgi:hypothetical protein